MASPLLVLDNCEHVADRIAAVTAALLEKAPNLKVLATSRRLLGISGKLRFTLAGLGTSSGDEAVVEAERLFEPRAAAVRRDFTLDAEDRSSVRSICRHLDGMPLAIELVAARADVLSPFECERLLGRRFALLADLPSQRSVHRSLQTSMDWSYDILPADGRRAFDLFGVDAVAPVDTESGGGSVPPVRAWLWATPLRV